MSGLVAWVLGNVAWDLGKTLTTRAWRLTKPFRSTAGWATAVLAVAVGMAFGQTRRGRRGRHRVAGRPSRVVVDPAQLVDLALPAAFLLRVATAEKGRVNR